MEVEGLRGGGDWRRYTSLLVNCPARNVAKNSLDCVHLPGWEAPCGFCNTCPRDTIITIGNVIIEATMSRRARYLEYLGTRDIVRHLYRNDPNMLWKAAPRPSMNDSMV